MKFLLLIFAAACPLLAQEGEAPFQIHGQATVVTQAHPAFPSPYQGTNSLRPEGEAATSFTTTLQSGFRLWTGAEFYLDGEAAAGKGVSKVLGLAGAPNGETYRVGDPSLRAGVVRAYLRQNWDLGGEIQKVEEGDHQLSGSRSSRRLTLVAGKFSVMDLFDGNAYAHDPRTQFLNWTLMGQGAWDYPADTRGYTWGFVLAMAWDEWAFRAGRFAMPLEANQMAMDHDLGRSHGDALEAEHGHQLGGLPGTAKLLLYRNTAPMGNYRQSLQASPGAPDVTATRAQGREKHGWGLNLEQALTQDLGLFSRYSWNDGRTETWVFTEVDRSICLGLSLKGGAWGRSDDGIGLAFVENGLSPEHRDYLAAGGYGFLLGDGRLNYASERIAETYYSLRLGKRFTASLDGQRCWRPAYNRDRGPVTLLAARLHLQF